MSKGIFGGLFDLNHDGKMNAAERALEFAILEDMLSEEDRNQTPDVGFLRSSGKRKALLRPLGGQDFLYGSQASVPGFRIMLD